MATTRDSAFYTSQQTNKYLQQPSNKYRGHPIAIPFELTVVSVAASADVYNLGVIKAQERVIGIELTTSGLGASAGAGRTVQIGDSGDDDRYMAATDVDLVNQSGFLASAGQGYTPTADTVFFAKAGGAALTVGGTVKGVLYVLAPYGT